MEKRFKQGFAGVLLVVELVLLEQVSTGGKNGDGTVWMMDPYSAMYCSWLIGEDIRIDQDKIDQRDCNKNTL